VTVNIAVERKANTMSKRHKAIQPDMRWSEPEGFQLEVISSSDGWAIQKDQQSKAEIRAEQAKRQGDMFPDAENGERGAK
jgi:hypothetical protein